MRVWVLLASLAFKMERFNVQMAVGRGTELHDVSDEFFLLESIHISDQIDAPYKSHT